MNKKNILTVIVALLVVIVTLGSLIFRNIVNDSIMLDSVVNLEDGLQREELESLNEDDYRKLNSPDIYNLDLDEVDNNYYYKMVEMPGIYKANATREEREKINLYNNDLKAVALEMCKKNGNWSLIINGDKYGEYNQNDGLLKEFNYISLESGDWVGDDTGGYVDIIAKSNDEERKYRISIYKEDGIISNIIVKLGDVTIDGNNELELSKIKFDKEHAEDNFKNLSIYESAYKGGLDWNGEDIGITEKFYGKYHYFLDIFIHYSPLEYNKITLKELDIDNQIANFEVDSMLECKRRTYDVKYELDNDLYLDDVEVILLNEINIPADRQLELNYNGSQSFYLNTNWELYKKSINCSNNFLNKLKSQGSDFVDIELLDYNFKFESPYYEAIRVFDNEPGGINKFKLKDGTYLYYYRKFIRNNKKELDDVINIKLPYDNSMTLEEVRDAYIRDYVEKK